jgi:aspartate racemase
MRTVGLLGGMSWESSLEYERVINTEVRRRLGGSHSGDLLVRSYDFAAVERLQADGDWEAAGRLLAADARRLAQAGAAAVVLCTNTMHLVADVVAAAVDVPLLHIADATAAAAHDAGVRRVALLGTRVTMERDFLVSRLARSGLEVVVPDEPDRTTVHEVIYRELVRGVVDDGSRAAYLEVVERLVAAGADGVVAGCTEIELLVGPDDVAVPYFPTARLHALAAVEFMLSG